MLNKTLTKNEIIIYVADQVGLKKNQAAKLVNSFFELLTNNLANSVTIKLSKFGSFRVKIKKQRYGRNPKNLKIAIIPSHKVVVFKSAKILTKIINNKL